MLRMRSRRHVAGRPENQPGCGRFGLGLFLFLAAAVPSAAQTPASGLGDVGDLDGIEVETVIEYYDIEGESISDVARLLNGMRLEGPEAPPSQGLTRYSIDAEWAARAGGGRCAVDNLVVNVDIVITLPRWPSLSRRTVEDQAGWARIDEALREHEFRHRDLTIEAARELRDDLSRREATGCRALQQVVAGSINIVGGRLRERHAELDRSTPATLPIG